MGECIIKFIFFGNYFVGFLAVALSIETSAQLRIPFNSILYYLLLFCGTVMYYTYAYTGVLQSRSSTNLRSQWYIQHQTLVRFSQLTLLAACIVLGSIMMVRDFKDLLDLSLVYWLIVIAIFFASMLYYGLLPKSIFKIP